MARLAWIAILLILLMAACSPVTATGTPTSAPSPSPQEAFLTPVATPAPAERLLTIWLEPAYSPDPQTDAGRLLAERLSAFEAANPGTRLEVRTKASSGPAGILAGLRAASVAAPDVAPDLILLDRPSLEIAAAESLVSPLGNLLPPIERAESLQLFTQASLVEGSYLGEPIGADAEVLAFRADIYPSPPTDWTALAGGPRPFTFPANDPRAAFTLALYQAAGGLIDDGAGAAALQVAPLEAVLSFYRGLRDTGVLPLSSTQLTTLEESWAAVRDGRAASGPARISDVMDFNHGERIGTVALPGQQPPGTVVLHPWSWAVAATEPAQQKAAVELVRWLLDPIFLGPWTEALGIIPSSAPALLAWTEAEKIELINTLLASATLPPPVAIADRLGPALQQATIDTITGAQSPADAAAEAAASLTAP